MNVGADSGTRSVIAENRDLCDSGVGKPLVRSPPQGPHTCCPEPGSQPDFMDILENGENRVGKKHMQAYFLKANPSYSFFFVSGILYCFCVIESVTANIS